MKIRSHFNYKSDSTHAKESNHSPSQTVPGQSYTIAELLQKFTNGMAVPIGKEPLYETDPDLDDPNPAYRPDLDLTHIQEMQEEKTEINAREEEILSKRAQKAKRADQKAALKKELESEAEEVEKEGSKKDSAI